jgi:hypothetical protein
MGDPAGRIGLGNRPSQTVGDQCTLSPPTRHRTNSSLFKGDIAQSKRDFGANALRLGEKM